VSDVNDAIEGNAPPQIIASVVNLGERLREIECLFDADLPKGPVAVKFAFETVGFYLLVDAIDDSVWVANELPAELQSLRPSKVDDQASPWREALGAQLSWGWLQTNQQGYTDGLQLEFRGNERDGLVCIQMIALASTLELRTVARSRFALR
jgi:hypothetical protein